MGLGIYRLHRTDYIAWTGDTSKDAQKLHTFPNLLRFLMVYIKTIFQNYPYNDI